MKTYIFEATDGSFYGKFLVGIYDDEWDRRAEIEEAAILSAKHVVLAALLGAEMALSDINRPARLLHQEGWWGRDYFLLQDLSAPGNGSIFSCAPTSYADADVAEKNMTVCYLFVPFLQWIREQGLENLDALPRVVKLESN